MFVQFLFLAQIIHKVTHLSEAAALYTPWVSGLDDIYGGTHCYPIPPNMTLCHNVGYKRMFLPNFLDHNDFTEAIPQSNVWVALVNTKCHPDLKRFLCSLYAPVCIKGHPGRMIPPCQDLCVAVRDACLPRMTYFGFKWPEMVNCDKFNNTDVCIPPSTKNETKACALCDNSVTFEGIVSSYCLADFVLKAKIQSVVETPGSRSVKIVIGKKLRYLKEEGVTENEKESVEMEAACMCPQFMKKKSRWLIMAKRKPNSRAWEIKSILKWQRKDLNFRRAIRAVRKNKNSVCSQKIKMDENMFNIKNNQSKRDRNLKRRNPQKWRRRRERRLRRRNRRLRNNNRYNGYTKKQKKRSSRNRNRRRNSNNNNNRNSLQQYWNDYYSRQSYNSNNYYPTNQKSNQRSTWNQ